MWYHETAWRRSKREREFSSGGESGAVEQPFEKLGAFYLGRVRDLERKTTTSENVLYDSKDLTTHALCVGMTGSGKTGLCISLLEEAGIDGIPAIVVDPKGDIGNLLLTFPDLRPEDFRPWIDETEAARQGQTSDEYAKQVAVQWRDGLAEWGQDGARIRRFRDAVDLAVYTPGSSAGLPLTILKSFSAPPAELVQDVDAFRERVSAATAGLLALLGVDADPVRSREFILVSNLLDRAWREQRDMDLAGLIHQIQAPPFAKIGVMEVDTFFPAKDRLALSMTLNSLLASPAFAAWLEGDALDIQRLLYTPAGRPRISILSIAHLSESERMFFVTILLNELLTWVRGQAGTPSLRALFYMDEVFGFFPPVSQPAGETTDADAAQAGARVRPGPGAGHTEPRGPGLQRTLQLWHVVPRSTADRAGQGARPGWPGGRLGPSGCAVRPAGHGQDLVRARRAHVPDEQRPRERAGCVSNTLGPVLSARSADSRSDSRTDERASRRATGGRSAAGEAGHRTHAPAGTGRRPDAEPSGIAGHRSPAVRPDPRATCGRGTTHLSTRTARQRPSAFRARHARG